MGDGHATLPPAVPSGGTATAAAPGRRRTPALLAPLFVGQDMLLTFFLLGMIVILRERGASLSTLAVFSLAPLGLGARFLWAPLVDRYRVARIGHYTGWLVASQVGVSGCLVVMAMLDPEAFAWVLGAAVVALAFSSVQETAATALVIRIVEPHRRGVVNGVVFACVYVGILAGGSGFLLVYEHWGWTPAVLLIALPNAAAALVAAPLGRLERAAASAAAAAGQAHERAGWASLLTLFRDRAIAKWALVAIPLYVFGFYLASALLTPMMVDAGYNAAEVGTVQAGTGSMVGLMAALCSGFIVTRMGKRRTLTVFGLLRVVATIALLPLAAGRGGGLVVLAVALMTIAETTGGTVLYTVTMDASRPSSPGADFSTQQAVGVLIRILASPIALSLAAGLGYRAVLVGGSVVALLGTLAATRYQPPALSQGAARP